ncbi:MAG: YlxM family DNA-binding protein [Ruminococcus flavefaciens]|nr:YlxM family DNA-binding protein [Ruminococcus flavefaciens]
MNRLYEQTMLFDFYGELLTEHQRRIYEDAVYNDLSLSEIAEEQGISRQGVHDLIRRCNRILQDYEDRLHLVERFTRTRDIAREIQRLAEAKGGNAAESNGHRETPVGTEALKRIRILAEKLLQEL